jgi:hypothetical protein
MTDSKPRTKPRRGERRVFARHPSCIPVEICLESVVPHRSAELKDVSFGGMSFHTQVRLATGTIVRLRIPSVDPSFETKAMVIWSRESPGGGFGTGVQFTGLGEPYRIRMVERICYIEQYRKDVLEREGRKLNGFEAAYEWTSFSAVNSSGQA